MTMNATPLPPTYPDPDPRPTDGQPSAGAGQEEKNSFAIAGATDKSVSMPAHKASRIILLFVLAVFVLAALVGVYTLAKKFSVNDIYRWLHIDRPAYESDMASDTSITAEPTLTPGDSLEEIEADLQTTSLRDFDQETSSVKADVEAQY